MLYESSYLFAFIIEVGNQLIINLNSQSFLSLYINLIIYFKHFLNYYIKFYIVI